jgi:hypothetical protein
VNIGSSRAIGVSLASDRGLRRAEDIPQARLDVTRHEIELGGVVGR